MKCSVVSRFLVVDQFRVIVYHFRLIVHQFKVSMFYFRVVVYQFKVFVLFWSATFAN